MTVRGDSLVGLFKKVESNKQMAVSGDDLVSLFTGREDAADTAAAQATSEAPPKAETPRTPISREGLVRIGAPDENRARDEQLAAEMAQSPEMAGYLQMAKEQQAYKDSLKPVTPSTLAALEQQPSSPQTLRAPTADDDLREVDFERGALMSAVDSYRAMDVQIKISDEWADYMTGQQTYEQAKKNVAELKKQLPANVVAGVMPEGWGVGSFMADAASFLPTMKRAGIGAIAGGTIGASAAGTLTLAATLATPIPGDEMLALKAAGTGWRWGSKIGGGVAIGRMEAGLMFDELAPFIEEEGVDPRLVTGISAAVGGLNAAVEFWGFEKLLESTGLDAGKITRTGMAKAIRQMLDDGSLAGLLRKFGKNVAKGTSAQVLDESVQELNTMMGQNLLSALESDKDIPKHTLEEMRIRVKETAEATLRGGGLIAGAFASPQLLKQGYTLVGNERARQKKMVMDQLVQSGIVRPEEYDAAGMQDVTLPTAEELQQPEINWSNISLQTTPDVDPGYSGPAPVSLRPKVRNRAVGDLNSVPLKPAAPKDYDTTPQQPFDVVQLPTREGPGYVPTDESMSNRRKMDSDPETQVKAEEARQTPPDDPRKADWRAGWSQDAAPEKGTAEDPLEAMSDERLTWLVWSGELQGEDAARAEAILDRRELEAAETDVTLPMHEGKGKPKAEPAPAKDAAPKSPEAKQQKPKSFRSEIDRKGVADGENGATYKITTTRQGDEEVFQVERTHNGNRQRFTSTVEGFENSAEGARRFAEEDQAIQIREPVTVAKPKTYDEFKSTVERMFKQMVDYKPSTAGHRDASRELMHLQDSYPEWMKRFEDEAENAQPPKKSSKEDIADMTVEEHREHQEAHRLERLAEAKKALEEGTYPRTETTFVGPRKLSEEDARKNAETRVEELSKPLPDWYVDSMREDAIKRKAREKESAERQEASAQAKPAKAPPLLSTKKAINALPKGRVYRARIGGSISYLVREGGKDGVGDPVFYNQDGAELYAYRNHSPEGIQEGEARREKMARAAERDKAVEAKNAEDEETLIASYGDFLSTSPMVAGKQRKTLEALVKRGKQVLTRKELVEKIVSEGATIKGDRLVLPDGGFWLPKDLPQTAFRYAAHLLKKQAAMKDDAPRAEAPAQASSFDPKTIKFLKDEALPSIEAINYRINALTRERDRLDEKTPPKSPAAYKAQTARYAKIQQRLDALTRMRKKVESGELELAPAKTGPTKAQVKAERERAAKAALEAKKRKEQLDSERAEEIATDAYRRMLQTADGKVVEQIRKEAGEALTGLNYLDPIAGGVYDVVAPQRIVKPVKVLARAFDNIVANLNSLPHLSLVYVDSAINGSELVAVGTDGHALVAIEIKKGSDLAGAKKGDYVTTKVSGKVADAGKVTKADYAYPRWKVIIPADKRIKSVLRLTEEIKNRIFAAAERHPTGPDRHKDKKQAITDWHTYIEIAGVVFDPRVLRDVIAALEAAGEKVTRIGVQTETAGALIETENPKSFGFAMPMRLMRDSDGDPVIIMADPSQKSTIITDSNAKTGRRKASRRRGRQRTLPLENRTKAIVRVTRAVKRILGRIPPGLRVVHDPNTDADAWFENVTVNGKTFPRIVLNAAALVTDELVEQKLDHELGHYAFQDADMAKEIQSFLDVLDPETQARIWQEVDGLYDPDMMDEEMAVRALEKVRQIVREKEANYGAFRKLVAAVQRFLRRVLRIETSGERADRIVNRALSQFMARNDLGGATGRRESRGGREADSESARRWRVLQRQAAEIWGDAEDLAELQEMDMEDAAREMEDAAGYQDIMDAVEDSPKSVIEKFFQRRDGMLGKIRALHMRLRDEIADAVGEKKYGAKSRHADLLILLNVDLRGRTKEELLRFKPFLKDHQWKAVLESQALPPKLQAIADFIDDYNHRQGIRATSAGIITGFYEHYIARLWRVGRDERPLRSMRRLGVHTNRAKARTLSSVLEGWAEIPAGELGLEKGKPALNLAMPSATGAMLVASEEVENAIASKILVEAVTSMGLITEARDEAGAALAKEWDEEVGRHKVRYGKVSARIEMGRRIGALPATFWAHPDIVRQLNAIVGKSGLADSPVFKLLQRVNFLLKHTVLFWSLFHHQAFLRSFYFGTPGILGSRKRLRAEAAKAGIDLKTDGWQGLAGWKMGINAFKHYTPDVQLLVEEGLTVGVTRDWRDAALLLRGESAPARWWNRVVETQQEYLFEKLGNGLKVRGALLELYHLRHKYRKQLLDGSMTDQQLANMAATIMNEDFGGLHLERMGRSKTTQDIMRFLLLAPDWTESNWLTLKKAAKRGKEGAIYRAMWLRTLSRVAVATAVSQLILNAIARAIDDDDDDWGKLIPEAWADWKRAFGLDEKNLTDGLQRWRKLNWLGAVDLTRIMEAVKPGSTKDDGAAHRYYFSVLGHFRDPVKWILNPAEGVKHKGAWLPQRIVEMATGTDWRGYQFTTLPDLLEDGSTTKWGPGHTVNPMPSEDWTLPSFALYTLRQGLPVQGQMLWSWMAGETDAFMALGKAAGLMLTRQRETKKQKRRKSSRPGRPGRPRD